MYELKNTFNFKKLIFLCGTLFGESTNIDNNILFRL